MELMRWKGGKRFADTAERFGRAVPLEVFNDARAKPSPLSDEDLTILYGEISAALRNQGLQKSASIVWRLFLCHVAHPAGTPIYDVNVWRAWGVLDGWIKPKQFTQRPVRFDTYLAYRSWANAIVASNTFDQQAFDQALMAFGQFISSRWRQVLP